MNKRSITISIVAIAILILANLLIPIDSFDGGDSCGTSTVRYSIVFGDLNSFNDNKTDRAIQQNTPLNINMVAEGGCFDEETHKLFLF